MRTHFAGFKLLTRTAIATTFALAIGCTISCGGDGGASSGSPTSSTAPTQSKGPTVVRIQISPRKDTITDNTEGDTLHLTVVALDSTGSEIALPAPVAWVSVDTTVRVNAFGTMTLLSSGISRIAASSGKLTDTVTFNLHVKPKLQVHISPHGDSTRDHAVDDTVRLGTIVTDVFLNKDVTSTTPVTWSALDTAATVSATGNVIVHNSGSVRVVASAGNVADTVTLTLRVTLPTLRLASINGVPATANGPNAVADSFHVNIEVRNPPDGYVVEDVFFLAKSPIGLIGFGTPSRSNIQPGETQTILVRSLFAPHGAYDVYPQVVAGSLNVFGPHIPVIVTNKDTTPPQIQSLSPSQDTTWQAGTALKITFTIVDLESGPENFAMHATWAGSTPVGCPVTENGSVDESFGIRPMPVVLDLPACKVPLGDNTFEIAAVDRAGNVTIKTLKITGI